MTDTQDEGLSFHARVWPQLGPEIPVNRNRPDGLDDDEYILPKWETVGWSDRLIKTVFVYGWRDVTAIRLRADHPYYKEPVITDTQDLGPEIPVNGKRPEWLKDDDTIRVEWREEWCTPTLYKAGKMSSWHTVKTIRLRPDHPYYEDAPQWAIDAANKRSRVDPLAFARLIAAHETPPDPLLDAVREALPRSQSEAAGVAITRNLRAALTKRGLEVREAGE